MDRLFFSVSDVRSDHSAGGLRRSGAECVYQALAKGYSVSTLVRDPARLITPPGSGGLAAGTPMKHPHLKITQVGLPRTRFPGVPCPARVFWRAVRAARLRASPAPLRLALCASRAT